MLLTDASEEVWESIFQTATEEPRRGVRNPRGWLSIFYGAAASVGDSAGGCGVCWNSWGDTLRLPMKVINN